MALARGRWAEPLKTTTLLSGTGTPRWLGRAVGVRVTLRRREGQGAFTADISGGRPFS